MGKILHIIKKNPTLGTALVSLVGAIAGIFIDRPAMVISLMGVFAALLGVNQVVTPVTTMVEKVTEATTNTAMKVAEELTDPIAGSVGQITEEGSEIVETVIDLTIHDVLNGKQAQIAEEIIKNGKEH